MSVPEPTIFDHASVDSDQECQMYRGDGPEPCTNTADVVFVYEASSRPDDDRRRNCLACAECAPVSNL